MRRKLGTRGSFNDLMGRYPDVANEIVERALGPKKLPVTIIHQIMLIELRRRGVGNDEYPFCFKSKGYRGLSGYIKRLRTQDKENRYIFPRRRTA